ncbi:hypothetical protein D9M71_673490 [compost metagenome]
MHERREPGAKVIEGKTHAQTAEGVHGLSNLLVAAHHCCFGQFEFQPARIDAVLDDQPAQGGQQLAVLKLPETQVYRHVQRRQPVFAQGLHVAQRTGDDPVAQRHDQAALLGQRHELARRQQPALVMPPTDQRLEPDDAAIFQVEPGLVMQFQLIAP